MADLGNFKNTVEALFDGMDGVVSSKTVVGDPIRVDSETTLVPLVDVSFGLGAGCSNGDNKSKGSGGIGGKISPCAVLVIKNGNTRLVNIKNQDTITKLLDLVPEMVDRFTNKDDKVTEADVDEMLDSIEK